MSGRPSWWFPEYQPVGVDLASAESVAAYDARQGTNASADDALLDRLGVGAGTVLVDLACGTGAFAIRAAKRGALVHGVDVSPEMLAHASRRADAAGISVHWHHAGFLDFVHPGPPADVVTTKSALHQLPDLFKQEALLRAAEMVRPGGTFYLGDAIFSFEPTDAETELQRWVDSARDADSFTPEEFETHIREEFSTYDWIIAGMLDRAGFDIVEQDRPRPTHAEFRCIRRNSTQGGQGHRVLDPYWVFVSAALGLIGSLRYAIATVIGRARPNLVTWTLWAAAPLIAFCAQLDAGVGLPAVLTLAAGTGPTIVVGTALFSNRRRAAIGTFDVVCGTIATVALVVWLRFDAAPLAVILAVSADASAALRTVRKTWRDPQTEAPSFYVLVGLGATITLCTIDVWTPSNSLFASYVVINLVPADARHRHASASAVARQMNPHLVLVRCEGLLRGDWVMVSSSGWAPPAVTGSGATSTGRWRNYRMICSGSRSHGACGDRRILAVRSFGELVLHALEFAEPGVGQVLGEDVGRLGRRS